jgi:hypothetical protein
MIRLPHLAAAISMTVFVALGSPAAVQPPTAQAEPPGPFPAAHAHNDYEHERPLSDALAWGFCSVEADVFPVEGDLLVAHHAFDLQPARTLRRLYLEPLLARLKEQGRVQPGADTFTLLVDIKTGSEAAYALLKQQLEPLRPYLHSSDGPAPLQVVISGDRPIDTIAADADRLVGIDGRLIDLDRDDRPASLVPLVSDRWGTIFRWRGGSAMPEAERQRLERIVHQAHVRGHRLRFWATPEDPACWQELRAAGVDLIGTDDLEALARFLGNEAKTTVETSP